MKTLTIINGRLYNQILNCLSDIVQNSGQKTTIKIPFLIVIFFISFTVNAQDSENSGQSENSNAQAQANNPLANMTALNFHNYYAPKLANAPDASYMNTTWVRFAKPFANGKLLLRASAPLSTIGSPNGLGSVNSTSGLGDINAFLAYSFVSKPTASVGIGPLVTMPTASEDALGTGKWQLGAAFVAFNAKSPVFQWGTLITWQASVGGDKDRENTNNMAFQPFFMWQLGKGLYLRSVPIWYFDFKNDSYMIPYALGIGKVFKIGNSTINAFIEPQYTALSNGVQPQFQVFTGLNFQFSK